jgi:hypothetical protein
MGSRVSDFACEPIRVSGFASELPALSGFVDGERARVIPDQEDKPFESSGTASEFPSGITPILERFDGAWWRWYLRDGKPYAFIKEPDGTRKMLRTKAAVR